MEFKVSHAIDGSTPACRQAPRLSARQCNEDPDRLYGESFQDRTRNFFPSWQVDGFFHGWFLVGETPHISVHYFLSEDGPSYSTILYMLVVLSEGVM